MLLLQHQQVAGVTAAAGAAGVGAAKRGGGPAVGREAIGAGRWRGKLVWVVGMYVGFMGWPTECRRKTIQKTDTSERRLYFQLLVRDNTWAGPRKWRDGPYRARLSWASPSMPWAGQGREKLKVRWAGPGHGRFSEKLMGRAGSRPNR